MYIYAYIPLSIYILVELKQQSIKAKKTLKVGGWSIWRLLPQLVRKNKRTQIYHTTTNVKQQSLTFIRS